MGRMLPIATDFATLFGRLLMAFRHALRLSQTQLGDALHYDRSLVARLEAGRNLPTLDNLLVIERELLRGKLLKRMGDLTLLTHQVGRVFRQRGVSVRFGKAGMTEEVVLVDTASIDRVVASVLDGYFAPPAEPSSGDPDGLWDDEL